MAWYVYLARCADRSLYCGIAKDVAARIAQHDAGKGARYTRGRGPLTVLLTRRCKDQGAALRLEYQIKQLTPREKLALVAKIDASRDQRRRRRGAAIVSAASPR